MMKDIKLDCKAQEYTFAEGVRRVLYTGGPEQKSAKGSEYLELQHERKQICSRPNVTKAEQVLFAGGYK